MTHEISDGLVQRSNNSLSAVRADSGVKAWKDLKSKAVPFTCSGLGSQTCQVPALINGLLGTKIKIVRGYKGSKNAAYSSRWSRR